MIKNLLSLFFIYGSSISSLFTAHCYANEVRRHTNPSNFGMMKVNSGHPNRNIRYYDSEGTDYDTGKVANKFWANCLTLISRVRCLGLNQSSAVLRAKSVECSA